MLSTSWAHNLLKLTIRRYKSRLNVTWYNRKSVLILAWKSKNWQSNFAARWEKILYCPIKYVKLSTCRKRQTLCFCTLKFLSWCLYQTPKTWWNTIRDVRLCFDMYITQWDNIPMHPIEPGIVPSSWLKSMLFPIITRRGKTSKSTICVVIQRFRFCPLLVREKSWWDAIHETKTFRWKAAVHLSNMCGMASKNNPLWIIQLNWFKYQIYHT